MSEHIDQIEQVTQTELLEQESSEGTVKESANKARPLIEVQHLTKKFGDLTVLDDISDSIGDGEKVVIIGPSGGGKSTFLRCLNVLEDPTSGKVFFDGVDLADVKVDINEHRRKMNQRRTRRKAEKISRGDSRYQKGISARNRGLGKDKDYRRARGQKLYYIRPRADEKAPGIDR